MYQDNRKQVNRILAKTLVWCTFAPIGLMICNWIGIFNFTSQLKMLIIGVGMFATVGPYVLYLCKVPDRFLQYYMHIVVAVFIGLLGTQNGIGIYITYVLVPVLSMLYFDKKFTLKIGIFSYFMMVYGVYVNTAGKLEIFYKNWTHGICFRNYIIGFTMEYIIIMIFAYQVVMRANRFMEMQQNLLGVMREENEQQKNMTDMLSGGMTAQRRSVIKLLGNEMHTFTEKDYARLAAGNSFNARLQEIICQSDNYFDAMSNALGATGEFFGVDRIMYIEPDFEGNKNTLSYQWVRNGEDAVSDFYEDMTDDEAAAIVKYYDENGYITFYESDKRKGDRFHLARVGLQKYMTDILLGAQLWIPTLSEGKYNGAVCFDKHDPSKYSIVDIFLLSEAVTTIALNVVRVKADNANRAKSAFLSSMSHEIRTPMNAILGMTTVALREDMNPTVRKSLGIIKSSSEGLLTIINDILDFSKIESGKFDIVHEKYQTLSILNDLVNIVNARNAEKGLKVNFDFPENLPTSLKGDAVRVKQVMVNLANNAIKYTDKGSVTIKVRCNSIGEDRVMFCFDVIDTGIGIKEADMDKLFTSFSQFDKEKNHHKEGTGLGLAISKQLVELMNGQIFVKSTYGKGSVFSFEIPQAVVDATPCGKLEDFEYSVEADDGEKLSFPGVRALIVDDNEINLVVAEALFGYYDLDITTANSGTTALNLIEHNTYDLIFMDHFMPDIDGVEVTRRIRALDGNPNQNVTIIAMTADAVAGVKEEMLENGMDDFLSKPIDMKLARRLLKKYLGDRQRN